MKNYSTYELKVFLNCLNMAKLQNKLISSKFIDDVSEKIIDLDIFGRKFEIYFSKSYKYFELSLKTSELTTIRSIHGNESEYDVSSYYDLIDDVIDEIRDELENRNPFNVFGK